jgi:hypothetical protein
MPIRRPALSPGTGGIMVAEHIQLSGGRTVGDGNHGRCQARRAGGGQVRKQ